MERKWRQCTAKRTVDNANFKGGVIDFDFSVGSNTVWIPAQSYFRIGVSLKKNDGTHLAVADDVTFANFCPGNLFDNCFFYAGGSNVSSCINYGPQAHAVSYRLSKSGAWLNSIGKDAYGICASYQRRLSMVASDGETEDADGLVPTRDGNSEHTKYFMYQPPIGIMNEVKAMGSGQYRFQFNPSSNYQFAALESGLLKKTDGVFNVTSMELYVCEEKMDTLSTGRTELILMEHHVQSKKYDSNLDFTVPPSTKAISIFLQSNKAGSTDFKIPPSRFVTEDLAAHLTLQSLQLTYANCTKPPTNVISDTSLHQRWFDCQLESGQAFSSGGSETLADWKLNGPVYHFAFQRDSNDRSTNVQLSTLFSTKPSADDSLFIVSHYSRTVVIDTESGFITNVTAMTN